MQRLIAIALVAAGGAAHAQPAADPMPPSEPAPDAAPAPGAPATRTGPATAPTAAEAATMQVAGDNELGDQAIAVGAGLAAGGRVTPGGLRVTGRFLYQLSDEDWFDGGASFTYGSGGAECFRDRVDMVVCNHGLTEGKGVELTASVRRVFPAQGAFRPYARVGVGLGYVRFSEDDVSGITVPAHVGAGVRLTMAPGIGFVVEGDLALGFGSFSRRVGSQPQLGIAIGAGVEFRLK